MILQIITQIMELVRRVAICEDELRMLENNDLDAVYACARITACGGFTLLHKLVLLTKKYPELNDVIKEYIAFYPEEINKVNELGWSALHLAARNSNIKSSNETVRILLQNGAIIDAQLIAGHAALMLASMYTNNDSNIETVKLLLDNDVTIDMQNNGGYTTLMVASEYSSTTSSIETVKLLLDYGATINMQSNHGYTALMIASEHSNTTSSIETVKLLLKHGADINMQNKQNFNALHIAANDSDKSNMFDVIDLLLASNVNVNLQTNKGNTALHFIASRFPNNFNIIKKFIDHGADINIKGDTFLKYFDNKIKKQVLEYALLKTEDSVVESGKVPTCVICMTNIAIILVTPCNHLLLCSECYRKSCEDMKNCPSCRHVIESRVRVFF